MALVEDLKKKNLKNLLERKREIENQIFDLVNKVNSSSN